MSCKIEIDGKVYEGEWSVYVTGNKVYVDGNHVDTLGEEVLKKEPSFYERIFKWFNF